MADPETPASQTLEEGEIFFLYRPTVDTERPHDLSEVQHLYIVLRPRKPAKTQEGGAGRLRLLIIGKKRLPEHGDHRPNWGFVDQIADKGAEIEEGLRETHYTTKTAGERTQGAARPAGEGAYALARVKGEIHLRYALALPEHPGEVQQALGIEAQAGLAVSIKNPDAPGGNPRGGGGRTGMLESHDPGYSAEEQALFAGNRWTPADPRLLDHRGAEFLLIAVHDDVDLEASAPADEDHAHSFTQLKLARTRHPVEPLFTGEWA